MTDLFFNLLSNYGVFVLFVSTLLSCLFVPIPSSLVMIAAGAFVASGDLALWSVLGAAYLGALIGDQVVYRVGRANGDWAITRLSRKPSRARMLARSQTILDRHGGIAVFLSTWAFAQISSCVNIIAGIAQLSPWRFFLWDAAGEVIWVGMYVGLGYIFSGQLETVITRVGQTSGVSVLAGAILVIGLLLRFRRSAGALSVNPGARDAD
ncbi:MAG: DedA family protein [Pseudoprimorskyibacter sp.]|nr:DedA family protein [Pseudoprimorskyibacter sp.]